MVSKGKNLPTVADRLGYQELWRDAGPCGEGRKPEERERLFRARRYRKPGDSGEDGIGPCKPKPPPDSSYRCQATKRDGERCTQWACRGQRFCRMHRGNSRNAKSWLHGDVRLGAFADQEALTRRLPVTYSKYLSDSLKSRLIELAGDEDDPFDLTEDMRLAQSTAVDAAMLYDVTKAASEQLVLQATTPEQAIAAMRMTLEAGQVMRETLDEVGSIVERAQRVREKSREVVRVEDLGLVVNQLVLVAHEVFGEERLDLVQQFAEAARRVRLPRDGTQGTNITPDRDVLAMDSTVPNIG